MYKVMCLEAIFSRFLNELIITDGFPERTINPLATIFKLLMTEWNIYYNKTMFSETKLTPKLNKTKLNKTEQTPS